MKRILSRITKFTDDYKNKEAIILRDHLAMERTKLANERTLLSYIRSSLYLIVAGIAILEVQGLEKIKYFGYLSLAVSVVILVIGIVRFQQLKKHLKKIYKSDQEISSTKIDNP